MEKEVLNFEEAAKFLEISSKTFNQLLKDEDIPARKIGREWRFSKKALLEWLGKGSSRDYFKNQTITRFEEVKSGKTENLISHAKEILDTIAQEKSITIEDKRFEFPDNVEMEVKIKKRVDTIKFELEFEWQNEEKGDEEDE
ncbi:helix-turn-helix domain-containing protein [Caldicellulosiruptor naganoensis]|uniref:Helix-turn-helix domain-containing protein n=1 Tax=Caldicellulosiruptor naganoensis TaxID=29324 RepID=A0ABY7BGJ6_9FIRM|nr:helix-turn-helix domain-containing protein [Caldicellulosiruptor naganoensis]WAM31962.1 helix-turn-helix domain-containing protein [Caldicellulosiruptor naganoensis]